MKKVFLAGFILLIILGVIGVGGAIWLQNSLLPRNATDRTQQNFLIKKGTSGRGIAQNLETQGLIKNALAFNIYLKLQNVAKSLPPGEYKLSPSESVSEIVDTLLKGPVEVWVTLPEGLRHEEIALKFIQGFGLTDKNALKFYNDFISLSGEEEGKLYPDTYLFPKDAAPAQVLKKLKDTYLNKVDDLNISPADENRVLTLASILERETAKADEAPVVAGILLKRENAGWPLQADASVQYAVGSKNCKSSNFIIRNSLLTLDCTWWPILSHADLEINSPFNTYKILGLPPSPIANPGYATIKAAAHPEDSPYWYYLHDTNGKIHYAKTLEEHNQNINQYLAK